MSKHYTKKQRKRDDRIIMIIYGLVIVAFLSFIFMEWYAVFRTTRYYNTPYPVVREWQIRLWTRYENSSPQM